MVEEGSFLRAFFLDPQNRSAAMTALGEVDNITLQSVDVPREDWLARYEQSLEPIFVQSKFVVAPDAALIPSDTEAISIVVPQERAFGTGSHETTWMCLSLMEQHLIETKRCVDIGTGSGILAMAMAKLGARKVVAFDNDLDTFGVVPENLRRNGIPSETIVEFYGGPEALAENVFDYATMNIIPEVIIPLLPSVRASLRAGARILLSGILIVRKQDVVDAASSAGLELVRDTSRGEWWCGEFRPH